MAVDPALIRNDGSAHAVRSTLVKYARQGGSFGGQLFHVQDEKDSGTAGGTFSQDAWRTRDLTDVKTNEIAGASLGSNQVTLPAGTYWAEWTCPAWRVDQHITRLYDTTAAAELGRGGSAYTAAADNIHSDSTGATRFTLSTESVIEVQHACDVTNATNGFGLEVVATIANVSGDNVYTILRIWKVA